MRTISDLFSVNTKGVSYDDISVYIWGEYRSSISNVWSDCGYDISFQENDDYMFDDEYFETISMSEISQVFCQNPNISRATVIDVYQDGEVVNVDRIEFDFNNNVMYLIVK